MESQTNVVIVYLDPLTPGVINLQFLPITSAVSILL